MSKHDDDVAGVITHPPLIYLGFIVLSVPLHGQLAISFVVPGGELIGVILAAGGFVLATWSVVHLMLNKVNPDPGKPTRELVTSGPYRYSRNPIYVAYTLLQLGIAIWSQWGWIAIMLLPATLVMIFGVIMREERYLEKRFGERYAGYRSTVRRWI